MSNLLSQNQAALKMLFTDDLYFIPDDSAQPAAQVPVQKISQINTAEKPVMPAPEQQITSPAQTDFDYIGENNKYFLILIDDKIHTRINPVHQEMLLKVMGAKKLELRDLAILNISRYPEVKLDALRSFFSCNRIALFGVSPAEVGLPALKANTVGTAGSIKVLSTFGLEEMRNNADKKREFWNVMKNF